MANAGKKIERKYRSYGDLQDNLRVVPSPDVTSPHTRNRTETYPVSFAHKAYRALHIGFVAVPLVAGIDKFALELAEWASYLAPIFPRLIGIGPEVFLYGVGAIEIMIGIGMVMRPRLFADIFSFWLGLIIVNLIIQGEHFDVALFNFGLAAGACALARLSKAEEIDESRAIYPQTTGPSGF